MKNKQTKYFPIHHLAPLTDLGINTFSCTVLNFADDWVASKETARPSTLPAGAAFIVMPAFDVSTTLRVSDGRVAPFRFVSHGHDSSKHSTRCPAVVVVASPVTRFLVVIALLIVMVSGSIGSSVTISGPNPGSESVVFWNIICLHSSFYRHCDHHQSNDYN